MNEREKVEQVAKHVLANGGKLEDVAFLAGAVLGLLDELRRAEDRIAFLRLKK